MANKRRQPKVQYPTFMVFAESVPESIKLHDPATTLDERAQILTKANADMDVARAFSDRNTQQGPNAGARELRDRVMRDLKRNTNGRPQRGEPKRLATLHDIPVSRVRDWIRDMRKPARAGGNALPDDWRTVYYGQAVRHQARIAGRQRTKKS